MDRDEALGFLRQHQPLPNDLLMSEEVITQYDEVRRYFRSHPDVECVPLFLNSFGQGDGFGVYVLVDEVVWQFPPEQVLPHLIQALSSPLPSVRYWCAQIAANFPSPDLVEPLTRLLNDADEDIPFAAVTALEQIGGNEVKQILEQALSQTGDKELRSFIEDSLHHIEQRDRSQRRTTTMNEANDEYDGELALSPQNYPLGAYFLKEDFYWDCTDESSPFGNDTGADTFTFFQEWREEHPRANPIRFLNELLKGWEVKNADWDVTDPQEVLRLFGQDDFNFLTRDAAVIAVAFGQILLEGKVHSEVKERALLALQRQLLPEIITGYHENYVPQRREQLEKMKAALAKF